MKSSASRQGRESASQLISNRIEGLGEWRGETLSRVCQLIREADPEIVEEWKGTPIWSHNGLVCTGGAYKNVVKITFFRRASLNDPARLFNANLDGNVRRAIDIRQDDKIDETALTDLIRAAVALNLKKKKQSTE